MHNDLYQIWTRQLILEFQDICWKYKVDLTVPSFEITKAQKVLGAWHSTSKTIQISVHLIRENSWDVTLNVLKHEMAHQICSEIFQSLEVAHGQKFQEACAILGVPIEYRSASGDRPEILEDLASSDLLVNDGRRILAKVEKLLALSMSTNENEAALAFQKANALIEKYNLDNLTSGRGSRYTSVIINHKKKKISGWQKSICLILRDYFFVKTVISYLYEPTSNQTHKTIELLGTSENVAVADYCYWFLTKQLQRLWEKNRHKFNGKTRTEKNSYYLGVLKGFQHKLKQQRADHQLAKPKSPKHSANSSNETRALMIAEDHNLNKFIKMKFPRLRTVSGTGPRIYKSTYEEGMESGKKIILHSGVEQNGGSAKRLPNSI